MRRLSLALALLFGAACDNRAPSASPAPAASGDDVLSLFGDREVTVGADGRIELATVTGEDFYRAAAAPVRVCGEIRTSVHPPGTKLAGETIRHFVEHERTHWFRAAVTPEDGSYVVTMRELVLNEGYAPKIAVAMATPVSPVWLSDFQRVGACPE